MVTHVAGKKALLTSAVKCKRWLRYYIRLLHNVVMRYTTARATTGALARDLFRYTQGVSEGAWRTIFNIFGSSSLV